MRQAGPASAGCGAEAVAETHRRGRLRAGAVPAKASDPSDAAPGLGTRGRTLYGYGGTAKETLSRPARRTRDEAMSWSMLATAPRPGKRRGPARPPGRYGSAISGFLPMPPGPADAPIALQMDERDRLMERRTEGSATPPATAWAVPTEHPHHTLVLRRPYLLFLGEETSPLKAKTAYGLRDWAPDACMGQWRMPGCGVDLGLPDLDPAAAVAAGAGSLVIGVTPPEGRIQPSWEPLLVRAVTAGLDIVSGLHTPLEAVPGLAPAAARHRTALVDVRRPPDGLPRATGRPRSGKRVLTVGTDCALGKKYTALALAQAMRAQGAAAEFRATGQTGIMIAGAGIAVDAVVADFVAGAAECISPAAEPDHWDVIEGQGSLFHPAYSGVTLGLMHGSQPDALILCHDPLRAQIVGWPDYPLPGLRDATELYLRMARMTNPSVRLAGISLNTSAMDAEPAWREIEAAERILGVPAFDPMRTSMDGVVADILQ